MKNKNVFQFEKTSSKTFAEMPKLIKKVLTNICKHNYNKLEIINFQFENFRKLKSNKINFSYDRFAI